MMTSVQQHKFRVMLMMGLIAAVATQNQIAMRRMDLRDTSKAIKYGEILNGEIVHYQTFYKTRFDRTNIVVKDGAEVEVAYITKDGKLKSLFEVWPLRKNQSDVDMLGRSVRLYYFPENRRRPAVSFNNEQAIQDLSLAE